MNVVELEMSIDAFDPLEERVTVSNLANDNDIRDHILRLERPEV